MKQQVRSLAAIVFILVIGAVTSTYAQKADRWIGPGAPARDRSAASSRKESPPVPLERPESLRRESPPVPLERPASLRRESAPIPLERPESLRSAPAPYSGRYGTSEYYKFRDENFSRRNPGLKQSYYEDFGAKYVDRFERLAPHLTPRGQQFIKDVGPALQRAIEEFRRVNPSRFANLERDPVAFHKFAISTHPQAYYASGWANLPTSDQAKIIGTIDPGDLASREAIRAIRSLTPGLFPSGGSQAGQAESHAPAQAPARGVPGKTTDGKHYRF